MSNITKKTYNAKIGLSNQERENFNTNAVAEANRVASEYIAETTEQLETALAGVEQYGDRLATAETEVAKKAYKDGYYSQLHSGLADNIASPDGITQEETLAFRPTGGTANITDGYAEIKEIRGNTWIKNQLVENVRNSLTGWNGLDIVNNGDKTLTFNGTFTGTEINFLSIISSDLSLIAGHKYLIKGGTSQLNISIYDGSSRTIDSGEGAITSGSGQDGSRPITANIQPNATFNNVIIRPKLIDLTKMGLDHITSVAEFNNLTRNIDTDTYDEGTPIDTLPTELISTGFNAFDGEWELTTNNTIAVSKNFIPVACGKEYTASSEIAYQAMYFDCYDKNFNLIGNPTLTVLSSASRKGIVFDNCCYVKIRLFNSSGIKIKNFCFHLTHSGYRDGQHEPYVKNVLKLPEGIVNEPLRSAGDAYDSRFKGQYVKRIGVVDLGTVAKSYSATKKQITCEIFNIKYVPNGNVLGNIQCAKYENKKFNDVYGGYEITDKTISLSNGGASIWINDSEFTGTTIAEAREYLKGKILYYELANPITLTKNYTAKIDLGSLDWSFYSNGIYFARLSGLKLVNGASLVGNILCSKYGTCSIADLFNINLSIACGNNDTTIYVHDNSYTDVGTFKTAMSGVILTYETAEPIDADYVEEEAWNIPVSDFGTLQAVSSGNNLQIGRYVIFYMNNLRDFTRNIGNREDIDWKPENIVSQQELLNAKGVKLYRHIIEITTNNDSVASILEVITTRASQYNTYKELLDAYLSSNSDGNTLLLVYPHRHDVGRYPVCLNVNTVKYFDVFTEAGVTMKYGFTTATLTTTSISKIDNY